MINSTSIYFFTSLFLFGVLQFQRVVVGEISAIFIASPVKEGYASYIEIEDLNFDGQMYRVHYKFIYKHDTLVQLKRYLPEGSIAYTIGELKYDAAIYKGLNVAFINNLDIRNKKLYSGRHKSAIEIKQLDKNHYLEKGGDRIFVIE